MVKTLEDRILDALKKEGLTALELSERIGVGPYHFILWELEKEGLIECDYTTDKWHLKRR